MRGKSGRESQKGITLLEILIVVAIVGILAAFAVGSFRETSDKYKVESEIKEMFANLMDVRGRAMQRSRVSFVRMLGNSYATYEDTVPAPDGNGILEITGTSGDKEVVRVTLAPAHRIDMERLRGVLMPGGLDNTFRFEHSGVASVTGLGFIRIITTNTGTRPDYDCINIGPTRVKMGQFNAANGGTCVEK
ncbi:MAG: prepilin-type N-terminal cleavage/methylation domain-containing protein, partial [Syntrophorhabdaceae bacterium]|nr:prepilin-type N-terminal cleavage/methylation domain-containing protein [Syntrophorhabdaceae bacterium]